MNPELWTNWSVYCVSKAGRNMVLYTLAEDRAHAATRIFNEYHVARVKRVVAS